MGWRNKILQLARPINRSNMKGRRMPTITADQLATINMKLATVVASKGVADAATDAATSASAALVNATQVASDAANAKVSADVKETSDFADLVAYVDGIANPA